MKDSSKSNYWQNGHGKGDFLKANIEEGVWSEGLRKKFDLCPVRASNAALSPQRSCSPKPGEGRSSRTYFE